MANPKAATPSLRLLRLSCKGTATTMLALLGIFFTTLVFHLLFVFFMLLMFFLRHATTMFIIHKFYRPQKPTIIIDNDIATSRLCQ